jgi:hypothetical protein
MRLITSLPLLSLFVLPAAYCLMQRRQMQRDGGIGAALAGSQG